MDIRVSADTAAKVAAQLAHAEMALRGGRIAGAGKSATVGRPSRGEVVAAYEFYYGFVTGANASADIEGD